MSSRWTHRFRSRDIEHIFTKNKKKKEWSISGSFSSKTEERDPCSSKSDKRTDYMSDMERRRPGGMTESDPNYI